MDATVVGQGEAASALAHALPTLFPTRFPTITAARRACRRGEVLLNGSPAPVDAPLSTGDEVTCTLRQAGAAPGPAPASLVRAATAQAAALLQVAYEDDHLALVVKPPGMPTQGAGLGVPDVQSLLPAILAPTSTPGALWRPRPVHRPDAWVGGLVLVAKTRPALTALGDALGAREVAWRYVGLVMGRLAGAGRVAAPLDGRPALTEWTALRSGRVAGRLPGGGPPTHTPPSTTSWVTAVQLRPLAGPPAQLRRHMALAGHPLVGDSLGRGGGHGAPSSTSARLGGSAASAASAAMFAAKRVARGGARRLGRGFVGDDEEESRNSASTARARFGRADGPGVGEGRAQAAAFEAASSPAAAAAAPPPVHSSHDVGDPWSALSGTTAVDRLRADAAADARAAAREAAAAAGGVTPSSTPSTQPHLARVAVPAPSLGRGWASRRGPPAQPSPPAAVASPWAAMAAAAADGDAPLAPRPPPPPTPTPHRSAAAAAAAYLAVDFDPPPLVVAGGGRRGEERGGINAVVPAGLLATPTSARTPPPRPSSSTRGGVPVCLWAVHVSLTHPVTGELVTVAIPPPADLALPWQQQRQE